jgi:hypothetical protein
VSEAAHAPADLIGGVTDSVSGAAIEMRYQASDIAFQGGQIASDRAEVASLPRAERNNSVAAAKCRDHSNETVLKSS